jgi:ubiquinone/menaquinone biosynthesis C-methylase UbiE
MLRRNFSRNGTFFLDAGCGAAPHTVFGKDFNFHVCVDFSKTGLIETKRKVKNGMFVMADLTNLPFNSSVFDGAAAMHVLYHLPKDSQAKAINELARVIDRKSKCLIAYSNLSGFISFWNFFPQRLRRIKRKNGEKPAKTSDKPPLNAHYFSLEYFRNLPSSGYKLYIRNAHFLGGASRSIVPNGFVGYIVYAILLFIERFFSKSIAKYSYHPAIILEKE